MQQYFVNGNVENPVIITDKDTVKHMFNVMRLTEGDEVVLVFSDGVKRLARVADSQAHSFEVLEDLSEQVELPVKVTIASGFPKGDKLEFLAQKVTELGASSFWGYPADWSVVKWDVKKLAKRQEKLEKIVLGAAEQSKRNQVPKITLFEKQADFITSLAQFDKIFIAYEESAKAGEQAVLARELSQLEAGANILFIFGPEGGISPSEVQTYKELGAIFVGLGPRIMRAETAPLYALSSLSFVMELW